MSREPQAATKQSQPESPARDLTHAEESEAQAESRLRLQVASLGSRVGTTFSENGDGPPSTPVLLRSVLLHPAAGRERANFFRTLQSRRGNHFVQRAVRALQPEGFPVPLIQRECACGGTCSACREEEEGPEALVQRNGPDSRASGSTMVDSRVIPAGSAGSRLQDGVRREMEAGFGRDLSDVQVHTDSSAAQSAAALNANAYTYGKDIYFAGGKYAPDSREGRRLLAHEIAHTVQQDRGATPGVVASFSSNGIAVGRVDDPLEAEADRAADWVVRSSPAGPASLTADRNPAIRGSWLGDKLGGAWEGLKSGGRWVGGHIEEGARAAVRGAEYVGGKVASAGRWAWGETRSGAAWVRERAGDVGHWALGKLQHAWECLVATGHATANLVTGDVTSVADLLGVPEPAGQDQSTFDTLIMVLKHPCLQMIPGYEVFAGLVKGLERAGHFLVGAWHLIENPEPVINKIRSAIGRMIAAIPAKAEALVRKALQNAGATLRRHGEGVWRHLQPKLDYLARNWWEVIKHTGWSLLWPWPDVKKSAGDIWDHVKSGVSNFWHLHPSAAMDDYLAILKGVNAIAGALYGWFLLASVLIGAVLGGIFGVGAGALPGAGAGLEFALAAGEGLVAATVLIETADLAKAAFNLLALNQTQPHRENDYERIAGSSLTLAITAVMFLLGELAVKFAEGLFSRVAGLFRAEPREVPVEVPRVEADGGGSPEVRGPRAEEPGQAPGETPAQQIETPQAARARDLAELEQKAHSPDQIHAVDDPALAAKYDAEIELGDHVYRRSIKDETWCRFSDPICGIDLSEINTEGDEALAQAHAEEPAAEGDLPTHEPTKPKLDGHDYERILDGQLLDLSDFMNPPGQKLRIDPDYIPPEDAFGRTNAQRASDGVAPILRNGEGVELHHNGQDFFGPLDEHSSGFHQSVLNDPEFHPFTDDPGYLSWRGEVAYYKGSIRTLGYIYDLIRGKYWRARFK